MDHWERLETEVCAITNGKKTPASGRLHKKGDVQTANLLIECKWRTKAKPGRSSLPRDWFDTASVHGLDAGLVPLVAYREDRDGVPSPIQFFCRDIHAHLFTTTDASEYAWTDDWVAVTADSVRAFPGSPREPAAAPARRVQSSPKTPFRGGGKSLPGGRPFPGRKKA